MIRGERRLRGAAAIWAAVVLASSCGHAAQPRGGVQAGAPAPAAPAAAQARLRSEWLQEPERAIPFMRRSADFWTRAYDPEHGGYFTFVARDGTPNRGRDLKTSLTQSRHAYAFARAYMVTGERKYLESARKAIAFLRDKGWDAEHGGFHTALDARGRNVSLTRDLPQAHEKWSFMQHYALLGIAAVYDAARSPEDLELLLRGRKVIDDRLWDARPGFEGYYETANYDWSRPRGKGFTPTVDGITTHGEALWLVTRDEQARARFLQLADAIVKHLHPTAATRKLGFAEKFDSNWVEEPEGFFFVGHVLKSAWCLGRAYMAEPKPEYRAAAEDLLRRIRRTAWDEAHGGPYYLGDSLKGQLTSFSKNYWTVEQAITGGLIAYRITGNPLYLEMADESVDFFARHLVDHEYGDVYDSTDASGAVVPSTQKGDYWKVSYHALETGWYVYLYGNLFLKHRPVTLHYAIDPAPQARVLPLDPIAMEPGVLVIRQVLLDGKPYSAFDAKARTLSVPAGTGGAFTVTFEATR
ncbi:MAG TPA: AGE family epimerase/isomerase [Anaeromyxobacter sp.]|nr:AGE family epimerase/isomerase [Anaeromyxobacter sp.]